MQFSPRVKLQRSGEMVNCILQLFKFFGRHWRLYYVTSQFRARQVAGKCIFLPVALAWQSMGTCLPFLHTSMLAPGLDRRALTGREAPGQRTYLDFVDSLDQ